MRDTIGVILAGGAGERLYPLTRDRAKPAVYFGGIYRIIDITLSNCINSGLRHIFIFTQYKSLSLNRHIREGWNILSSEMGEFIEIIPPMKRVSDNWYLGTADAVYQNIYSIGSEEAKHIMVLSGDHIYKMDYSLMRKHHVETGADLTIATIELPLAEASRFGVMEVDPGLRVVGFEEKPEHPKPCVSDPARAAVSMGIYCFNREALFNVLEEDAADATSSHDFGRDVIPKMLGRFRSIAYSFKDENTGEVPYWRDVGTIDAYFEANMDLVAVKPQFNLYDKNWPIRTYQRQYPPAKFVFAQEGRRIGMAVDSIVSSGCIISGGRVTSSVLSPDVRVNSYSEIENSIIFSHANIGRYSRVRRAIIGRDVTVPENALIGFDLEQDRRKYHVTESGIVVVINKDNRTEVPDFIPIA